MAQNKIFTSLPSGFTSPEQLSGLPSECAILVGFSGGADSTALLHMLKAYADTNGAPLYAAHINHCIRGEEADRDEAFCKHFAEQLGVSFHSVKIDVPRLARESGESIETAARRARYDYFDTLMKKHGIPILATAHNADDNLETIIFNIARGSGLSGICGIPQTRRTEAGVVVRPVLGMEKKDILAYCASNGLEYVTDSTNLETEYTRNKIRSLIIPAMRGINEGAVTNAYRMSKTLKDDSLFIESMVTWFCEELGENCEIDTEKLCGSPAAVVNRVLMHLYSHISGGYTLESTHIEALRTLARRAVPHSSVSLPHGICGVIEDGKLCLVEEREIASYENIEYSVPLFDGENAISQTNCEIFIGNSHNAKNIYKKSILLSLDFDTIEGELVARSRHGGDKIRIGGMNKSIKKLLNEKKIPLDIRSRLPIICDSKGVVAVPFLGVRDSARVKSNDRSEKKLYFYLY